ncbi:MAG: Anti-sigma-28 factor, FlgM [Proteobacteria bacterium]|nr:Anti-sigma-28 factor, FlgM [Pseudomonadota bacterium]
MDVFLHSIGSALAPSQTKKSQTNGGPEMNGPTGTVASNDSDEASLQLRNLTENAMSAPIVSQERISRIADAIANGQYQIDAQKAANKLVEFEFLAP